MEEHHDTNGADRKQSQPVGIFAEQLAEAGAKEGHTRRRGDADAKSIRSQEFLKGVKKGEVEPKKDYQPLDDGADHGSGDDSASRETK